VKIPGWIDKPQCQSIREISPNVNGRLIEWAARISTPTLWDPKVAIRVRP